MQKRRDQQQRRRTWVRIFKSGLLFNRLNDSVTRVQFSAVCRRWRWVARCNSTLTAPQFPWLMLDTNWNSERDDDLMFFSLSDGKTHTLHLPEAHGLHCCGSFEGWLMMQDDFLTGKKEKRDKRDFP